MKEAKGKAHAYQLQKPILNSKAMLLSLHQAKQHFTLKPSEKEGHHAGLPRTRWHMSVNVFSCGSEPGLGH